MILLDMLLEEKVIKAHDGVSILYEKDDFSSPRTTKYWWYYLNELREGIAVDFPIKLKTVLTYLKHRHAMHARVTFSGGWINRNIVSDVYIITKGKSINAEKNENVELTHA